MSLNRFQKKQNSRELNANFELSGLTLEELADRTGFSTDRLEAALSVVRTYDPADCWLVRDVLEQAVIDAGKPPFLSPCSPRTSALPQRCGSATAGPGSRRFNKRCS